MFRAACAVLAIIALMAWPAFAQADEVAQGADESQTETAAEAADEKSAAEEPAEAAKPSEDEAAEAADAGDAEEADADEAEADEADDEEVDYHRRGIYLGLAGVWGVEKFGDADDLNIDDTGGINVRVGYHALSWLSGELQGEFLPEFNIDFGSDTGDVSIWLAGANLRLNLPTDLIQPYVTLGGGYMGADLSGAGAGNRSYDGNGGYGRFGGGVEFYFWPSLALDLGISYVLPGGGDIDDLNFISINFGGLYRF